MADRAEDVATLIAESRPADPEAILCAIVSRWPDITGDELMRGGAEIEARARRTELRVKGRYISLEREIG